MPSVIWTPDANFLACSCHLAWGFTLVLTAAIILKWRGWEGWQMGIPVIAFSMLIWVKELVVDVLVEGSSIADETLDIGMYYVGVGIATAIWWTWVWPLQIPTPHSALDPSVSNWRRSDRQTPPEGRMP